MSKIDTKNWDRFDFKEDLKKAKKLKKKKQRKSIINKKRKKKWKEK
tara:strand:+ start:1065 stop:1202 length:138 start_codon:yes stop_codon:yes gene_type:complete